MMKQNEPIIASRRYLGSKVYANEKLLRKKARTIVSSFSLSTKSAR